MVDIPNTEYITVKRDKRNKIDIYVGDKTSTEYHGQEIYYTNYVKEVFAWMQEQNPEIEEFRIGAFDTPGEYAKVGSPSGKYGPNAWCGVKLRSGGAAWVFYYTSSSAACCAYDCAYYCARNVRAISVFRSAVFGAANEKQNALTNALKDTDLSQFIGTHKIGAYEIVVRKSGQNTRG